MQCRSFVVVLPLTVVVQKWCGDIYQMPVSDSEVRSSEAGDKPKVVSAGDSLYIVVYSMGRGGGKYFVGRMRHPPGAGAKQVEVQIGPFGKGAGK